MCLVVVRQPVILFLYNTGARASEAAKIDVAALTLDSPGDVRFLGKGRKIRTCPLWPRSDGTDRHPLPPMVDPL